MPTSATRHIYEDEQPHEAREHDRIAVCGTVQVKQLGAVAWQARLHNLSLRGFAIETAYKIENDRSAFLMIEGMEMLRGTIRWREGEHFGFELDRPLYGPVLDHLIERLTENADGDGDGNASLALFYDQNER